MKRIATIAAVVIAAAVVGCAKEPQPIEPPSRDFRAEDGSVGFRERIKATFPEAKIEFEEDWEGVTIARVRTTHPCGFNSYLTIMECEPFDRDTILAKAAVIKRIKEKPNPDAVPELQPDSTRGRVKVEVIPPDRYEADGIEARLFATSNEQIEKFITWTYGVAPDLDRSTPMPANEQIRLARLYAKVHPNEFAAWKAKRK